VVFASGNHKIKCGFAETGKIHKFAPNFLASPFLTFIGLQKEMFEKAGGV